MNQKYRLGLRAVKSAIAVFLCLLIAILFNRSEMLLASIAAIICMQQTCDETFNVGIHRLIGTVIGGVVGLIFLLIAQYVPYRALANMVFAPISILVVIYACNVINHKSSVVIGCIVALSVVVQQSDPAYSNTLLYVINRVVDTCVGIIVAMLINRYMFRKRSSIKLK